MSLAYQTVLVDVDDGIATLTTEPFLLRAGHFGRRSARSFSISDEHGRQVGEAAGPATEGSSDRDG